jgi:hypothetical protein
MYYIHKIIYANEVMYIRNVIETKLQICKPSVVFTILCTIINIKLIIAPLLRLIIQLYPVTPSPLLRQYPLKHHPHLHLHPLSPHCHCHQYHHHHLRHHIFQFR